MHVCIYRESYISISSKPFAYICSLSALSAQLPFECPWSDKVCNIIVNRLLHDFIEFSKNVSKYTLTTSLEIKCKFYHAL